MSEKLGRLSSPKSMYPRMEDFLINKTVNVEATNIKDETHSFYIGVNEGTPIFNFGNRTSRKRSKS